MSAFGEERDRIVRGFRHAAGELGASDPPWLPAVREAAIARFSELGFPSMKREDWRYTNVRPLAHAVAGAPPAPALDSLGGDLPAELDVPAGGRRLLFRDGRFDAARSDAGALPGDAVVDGLASVLRERPDVARPLLDRAPAGEERCFVALNAALQRDGAVVSLPAGVAVAEPIHLVFGATDAARGQGFHVRNVIRLGAGAAAVVALHHVGTRGGSYVTNAVTDVALGAGARLELVVVEREAADAMHLATVSAELAADATLRSHFYSLGARLARNEIDVALAGRGAACDLYGLYAAGGRHHVDNQSTVDHAVPHCTSRQRYKGVLAGRSRGVFNGTVIVRPHAQKSDAQQQNANLLLGDGAEVDTRPNLEIYADDVKCAHGSTVGRLDEDALFFLRARGIDAAHARRMLARAFAEELIEEVPGEALRHEVGRHVTAVMERLEEPS